MGGVACGNYGLPLCDVVNECDERGADGAAGWAVVEVSSFQMETTDLPPDAFEAAAILNLQEDHLDRHGSAEVYHGLKRRLLGMARVKWTARPTPRPRLAARRCSRDRTSTIPSCSGTGSARWR